LYNVETNDEQIWIYENISESSFWQETISFEFINCSIIGTSNNYFNIVIWPGETKRIDIIRTDKSLQYLAKVTKAVYNIKEKSMHN